MAIFATIDVNGEDLTGYFETVVRGDTEYLIVSVGARGNLKGIPMNSDNIHPLNPSLSLASPRSYSGRISFTQRTDIPNHE